MYSVNGISDIILISLILYSSNIPEFNLTYNLLKSLNVNLAQRMIEGFFGLFIIGSSESRGINSSP